MNKFEVGELVRIISHGVQPDLKFKITNIDGTFVEGVLNGRLYRLHYTSVILADILVL